MRFRAAALATALTFVLALHAALAAKPTRSLPRASAARSLGPDSLAHSSRRSSRRAASRSLKRSSSHASVRTTFLHKASSRTPKKPSRKVARAKAGTTRRARSSRQSTLSRVYTRRSLHDVRTVHTPSRAGQEDTPELNSSAASHSAGPWDPAGLQRPDPALTVNLPVASLYNTAGKLIVPAPLYGSHEILLRQNEMAGKDGSERVRDSAALEELLRQKKLVALPANQALEIDERLPDGRRYSRPWTAAFLAVLSHDYYAAFHEPLQVTSAVRTVEVQQRLVRTNGNAAPVAGETASPHLTGQAVDIGKHGLSMTQIAWLRTYLQRLIGDGKIDVEEEFQQACFHISVYRSYVSTTPHSVVASTQLSAADRQP